MTWIIAVGVYIGPPCLSEVAGLGGKNPGEGIRHSV